MIYTLNHNANTACKHRPTAKSSNRRESLIQIERDTGISQAKNFEKPEVSRIIWPCVMTTTKLRHWAIALGLNVLIWLGAASNLSAQVTVGFKNFTTIQAALDFVQANQLPNALITVEPGTYCENLQLPSSVDVELVSTDPANPDATVIDGKMLGTVISCSGGANDVRHTLRGFTVANGSNSGIQVFGGCRLDCLDCIIKCNSIDENVVSGGGGVLVGNGGVVSFVRSAISNNTAGVGGGIAVLGGGNAIFFAENPREFPNQISNNSAEIFGGGFFVHPNGMFQAIGNTTISDNAALDGGGGYVSPGASIGVNDTRIFNNMATKPSTQTVGGILFERNENNPEPDFVLDNIACVNNVGAPLGFRLNISEFPLTQPNNPSWSERRTTRNRRPGGGGPQQGMSPNVPIIRNCTFENGVTDMFFGDASAILLDGVDAMIIDCTFTGNESNNNGGAILCTGGATPTIMGCSFENNNSEGSFDEGAGAIVCDGVSPLIMDCTFTGNSARIEAGAIRNSNGASPVIQNCMFIGNSADRVAGAILNQNDSNPLILDCTFEMNMTINVSSEGGAIVNYGSSPVIEDCIFIGNSSDNGGAIFSESDSFLSSPLFSSCTFSGNIATGMGGAMDCEGTDVVLENCMFDANASASSGGAISFNDNSSSDPILTLTNCTFVNHDVSVDGAAIVGSDGDATFDGCSFINNSAGRNGGALRILSSNLTFKFCDFESNSAVEDGGAIGCFNSTNGTHIGCSFTGNSCGEFGGAVYYSESSVADYSSCEFSGNTSDQDGGALVTRDLPGDTISNCTFANNTAANSGGAIFANNNTVTEINNSIIWDNGNSAIHVDAGSTANVSFSNVEGGFAGPGNLNANPLFVDAVGVDGIAGTGDDDLSLQSGSPSIDTGNNDAVAADVLDLDGDLDVAEPLPFDMRMMVRFVDAPQIPDGGNGSAPIVDMGAFEFQIASVLLGDVNLDGAVNLLDVDPFIDRLSTGTFQAEADTNQDGVVNLLDVEPFINILAGGG